MEAAAAAAGIQTCSAGWQRLQTWGDQSAERLRDAVSGIATNEEQCNVVLTHVNADFDSLAGAVAPTLCPAGRYSSAVGNTQLSNCEACDAGSYCPIGSTAPTPCATGTYAASTGAAACTPMRRPQTRWARAQRRDSGAGVTRSAGVSMSNERERMRRMRSMCLPDVSLTR